MATPARRIEREIIELDGGIFTDLPAPAVPLEALRVDADGAAATNARAAALALVPDVDDFVRTQEMRRVQLDSIAPVAMHHAPPRPQMREKRSAMFALGAALAIGVGCLVGLAVPPKEVVKPAAPPVAQVVAATPATAEQTVAQPVQAPVAEAPAPVIASPAKQKEQPKAAPVKAAVPAPKAEEPVAAAPVSTADLPLEIGDIPPAPKAAEVPFKASSAAVAIADAGVRAAQCKEADGPLSVPVSVTFAPSGRATRATVNGGPLLGTPGGSCLAQVLRSATVPAFDGEPVTVNTTVHLR